MTEIQNSKRGLVRRQRFGHLVIWIWNLFRVSKFEFRIYIFRGNAYDQLRVFPNDDAGVGGYVLAR